MNIQTTSARLDHIREALAALELANATRQAVEHGDYKCPEEDLANAQVSATVGVGHALLAIAREIEIFSDVLDNKWFGPEY